MFLSREQIVDSVCIRVREKFAQKQLLGCWLTPRTIQTYLVGVETCSGGHFLGRVPHKQGHDKYHTCARIRWIQI